MKALSVLIAEDHKLFRELLISSLKSHKINTIGEAVNGNDLLDQLKTKKPDVILLDVEMPELNGYCALKVIKEIYPDQKVIMLTQHESDPLMEHLYEIGANAYLTKNTEMSVVADTIRLVYANKYEFKINTTTTNKSIKDSKFSLREAELIPLLCDGRSNKEIADQLKIGSKTVEAHKKNLFRKTKTMSALQCVIYLLKTGLNNLK